MDTEINLTELVYNINENKVEVEKDSDGVFRVGCGSLSTGLTGEELIKLGEEMLELNRRNSGSTDTGKRTANLDKQGAGPSFDDEELSKCETVAAVMYEIGDFLEGEETASHLWAKAARLGICLHARLGEAWENETRGFPEDIEYFINYLRINYSKFPEDINAFIDEVLNDE